MIGYNLQTLFTELKFNFSGSYANISKFFDNVTNGKINFSPKAINDCTRRIAEKLEPSYNKIEEELKINPNRNILIYLNTYIIIFFILINDLAT
jgi:hypothetical protein